jgi:hypothetical protein
MKNVMGVLPVLIFILTYRKGEEKERETEKGRETERKRKIPAK